MKYKNNIKLIAILIFISLLIFIIWGLKNNWTQNTTVKNNNIGEKNISNVVENEDVFLGEFNSKSLNLEELKSYNVPIIIYFGASWCPSCKELYPVLEGLYEDYKGKVIIQYVDIDKYQEIAYGYPIEVIPTTFFYNSDGTPYSSQLALDLGMLGYNNSQTGEHGLTAKQGFMDKESFIRVFTDMGVK